MEMRWTGARSRLPPPTASEACSPGRSAQAPTKPGTTRPAGRAEGAEALHHPPKKARHFDEEGLFDNFIKDSDRITYTINGRQLPRESKAVQDAFKEKIPNVRHRRALSCFFSQMSLATLTWMSGRRPMLDLPPKFVGYTIMDQPGADMFAGLDNSRMQHPGDACEVKDPRIALEVSEDGKRVTMKIEAEGMLLFANDEDIRDFCRPIGGFVWKEDIVFDLSGEEAVITETRIGQDLIPDIAPPAKEE